ncbi:hypothetical protein X772_35160 [Mesorhizobium sp. LSJC280B00]|nr:hypothetical protein X772_35160 [Mesorhizobium sp. LSJC280B00]
MRATRCDGETGQAGNRDNPKQIGTQFADPIRASSLEWLHQQAAQKTAPDQRAIMSNYLLHRGSHPQRTSLVPTP